ncbi:MAG: hypothetical protein FWE03_02325 [Firmicutes bacterium]|nr:hypothetical protein [Bacillota bacterium]
MTLGLIILGVVSILTFFGLMDRFFIKLGLKSWIALILVVGLVVGAVVPPIRFGQVLSINIGGFIAPVIVAIILLSIARNRSESFRAFIAMFAVASVAVATRMLLNPLNSSLILASALIIGFVGGSAAFLAGHTRVATVSSAIGGIILGDLIIGLIKHFIGGEAISLGMQGVFDSLIIASVFGLLLCEAINAIKRVNFQKKGAKTNNLIMAEAAQDMSNNVIEPILYNENEIKVDNDTNENNILDANKANSNIDITCPKVENNFFDEYISE